LLQNAWVANTKFAGMTGESDPLLRNREPIPGCSATANFVMPGASLRALRYFTQRGPG
jgi:hypothetical protein